MRFPWSWFFPVVLLVSSACAVADQPVDARGQSVTTAVDAGITTTSTTTEPEPAVDSEEYSDAWRIGVEYIGVRFVVDGAELDASTVQVAFSGRRGMSLHAGGCGHGGGTFTWEAGTVSDWDEVSSLMWCEPTDLAVHEAAQTLSNGDFTLSAESDRIFIRTDGHQLELVTAEQGEVVVINDDELFVGVATDVPGLEPADIQLTSPAFFVAVATTPTCQMHGAFTAQPDGTSTLGLPPRDGQCEFSPEADQTARTFLESGPTATRDGDSLTLASAAGSLTMRLAGSQDPVIAPVNVPPPPLVNFGAPDRPEDAARGRPSSPWFANRAGSTDPGGIDVPVPPEWEANSPEYPQANISGRGDLSAGRSPTWDPVGAESGDVKQTEGPVAVSMRTYVTVDGEIVESGTILEGKQYRYASETSYLRSVVWVLPDDDGFVVLTASFPEFPEEAGFGADARNQPLTGLDPIELLKDIRIFE